MKAATAVGAARQHPAVLTRLQALADFRYLALLSTVATYGLIVLGGTVRATDSGTACPDWPLCRGAVVPPLETKVLIEYSHRLAASLVGLLIMATVCWCWRKYRGHRLMAGLSIAAGVLLAGQILLGGVTVETETQASVVALHLSIALTLLATLITMTTAAFLLDSGASLPSYAGLRRALRPVWGFPLATLAGVLVLIIVGAYVSQTGAGLAYPDWPLFNGTIVSAGGRLADLHYAHRLIAVLAGILLAGFARRVFDEDRRPLMRAVLAGAVGLYLLQVLAGASNIWLELATWIRIVHLALASALWAVVVFAVAYQVLAPMPEARPAA